jgi:hypothetical protein
VWRLCDVQSCGASVADGWAPTGGTVCTTIPSLVWCNIVVVVGEAQCLNSKGGGFGYLLLRRVVVGWVGTEWGAVLGVLRSWCPALWTIAHGSAHRCASSGWLGLVAGSCVGFTDLCTVLVANEKVYAMMQGSWGQLGWSSYMCGGGVWLAICSLAALPPKDCLRRHNRTVAGRLAARVVQGALLPALGPVPRHLAFARQLPSDFKDVCIALGHLHAAMPCSVAAGMSIGWCHDDDDLMMLMMMTIAPVAPHWHLLSAPQRHCQHMSQSAATHGAVSSVHVL